MNRRKFIRTGALFLPATGLAQVYLPRRRAVNQQTESAPFTYYSSYFDGTNDYLQKASTPTGLSDGKLGTLSFWLKLDGSTGTEYRLMGNDQGYFLVRRTTGNKLQIIGYNSSTTKILDISTSSNMWHGTSAITGWVHFYAAWNLASAGTGRIYVNGASNYVETTYTNDSIDYARSTQFGVMSAYNGSNKTPGWVTEFWFTNEYIDDVTKFSSDGKPISLGSNGSIPTGTAAILYFANEYSTFQTNKGTGDGFTEVGEITDGGAEKP